jgi:hypothetical protein
MDEFLIGYYWGATVFMVLFFPMLLIVNRLFENDKKTVIK